MNALQKASTAISGLLRRKPGAGGIYAPTGTGGWTSLFSLTGATARLTGQRRLNDGERLGNNFGLVHVAVNRIAEDISTLKVTVEVRKRGGRWVPDPTHPLQGLLDQPVPWADGIEQRATLLQHLCLLGRAAVLVVDGTGGEPRELHLLYPHLLEPLADPRDFISGYRYTGLSGTQQFFPPYQPRPSPSGLGVLEMRLPDPTNPYGGSSPVQAGSSSISLDAEVRGYAKFYFQNNAMPAGVLESDQAYPGPEASRNQKEDWDERYQGMYNAGKVAVLWGGLKLRSMAPVFKDLAFPEITKATRQDILMHFGVPGPVLGYTEQGALGADTFKAAQKVYQSQTLDPHRRRLERFLNRIAARWENTRVVIESPVEADVEAIEKRQLEEVKAGQLSREEYRAARGYEPDGQPNVWLLPGTARVVHDLTPEAVATSTPPQPGTPSGDAPPAESAAGRAQRYRLLWAEEYRALRDAPPDERLAAGQACRDRWLAEGPDVAARADQMRLAALQAAQGDLVTAYEALKAEARALAEVSLCPN